MILIRYFSKENGGGVIPMVTFIKCFLEPFPVSRMRDTDQRLRPLPQVLAEQEDLPVFGDHPMHMTPRSDHTRPFMEKGYDPRNPRRSHGRQGNDRYAMIRQRSAMDKIHLPADPRILIGPDRIGANLARQIDLKCAVDSDHLWVLPDHTGVIYIGDIHDPEFRVVVDKVEQFPRPV